MSSVKRELEFAAVEIRPMNELDVPVVVAIERSAYQVTRQAMRGQRMAGTNATDGHQCP